MQNTITGLSQFISLADESQLLSLLKNADVSLGHLRGRYISVSGYSDSVTFTEFVKRVEEIYQANVHNMQEKQKDYDKNVEGTGVFAALRRAATAYPEMNEQEEAIVLPAIEWREKIDAEFDRLYTNSQDKLDQKASESCPWLFIKAWDSRLDTKKTFQSTCQMDKETFKKMHETRILQKKCLFSAVADLGSSTVDLVTTGLSVLDITAKALEKNAHKFESPEALQKALNEYHAQKALK